MLPTLYTETEIAAFLHRERRWLLDWLRANPTCPKTGRPFYVQFGRSKRFTADDALRMIDLILTQEEAGKRPNGEGWIYFVDGGEHIKIGYSRSIKTRLDKMQTDNPGGAKILLIQPGTFKTEKVLHRHFRALHIRGEWFRKGPELLQYIEERQEAFR